MLASLEELRATFRGQLAGLVRHPVDDGTVLVEHRDGIARVAQLDAAAAVAIAAMTATMTVIIVVDRQREG